MVYDQKDDYPNMENEARSVGVVEATSKEGDGKVVHVNGCTNPCPYHRDDHNEAGGGGGDDQQDDMLADINGVMFSDDAFPSLPDFPCLSSPSCASSSFAPCPSSSSLSPPSSSSSNSSSSTSWSVVKFKDDENGMVDPVPANAPEEPSGEDLLGMELLDEELWDPSSFFPDDEQRPPEPVLEGRFLEEAPGGGGEEDLAMMFFEWLKSNKETLSPEDLKSIKLKRSTIEYAVRRLGGGKEGMKHLLKLILAWVQSYHLEKRRLRSPTAAAATSNYQQQLASPMVTATTPTSCSGAVPLPDGYCSWFPPVEPAVPGFSYGCGEASSPMGSNENLHAAEPISVWLPQPPQHQAQYQLFTQQPSPSPYVGGYGGLQYPIATAPFFRHGHGENLSRFGSSATKEARKKRMARQRRLLSLHHHRHQRQQQQQQPQPQKQQPPSPSLASHDDMTRPWPPTNGLSTPAPAVVQQHTTINHTKGSQPSFDRRQGLKPEKNLRFLLQKVLKQSDVGSLGRIVLPKKEAETHLPELEARDGIPIAMEDIGTSRTWNMRYRFWPNNKSRMYLLENTGEFVKANGLQEGDFVIIYSDVKSSKFIIRGVKAKKPSIDSKDETIKNIGKQVYSHQLSRRYLNNNNDKDNDLIRE